MARRRGQIWHYKSTRPAWCQQSWTHHCYQQCADAPAERASACRAPWTTPRSGQPGAAIDFAKDGEFPQLP